MNILASKVSRNAGLIYRLKGLVPESVLKNLYNSFIQSHLNYCSSVWGLGTKSSLNNIFISQKKAVRAIENRFNNFFYNPETGDLPCHTKEIFTRNNILTVHNLIAKNCLLFMHKAYLNVGPENILKLFTVLNEHRPRRDPTFFDLPYSRLKSLDKTLPFKGPKFYNSIVNSINSQHNTPKDNNMHIERQFVNSFKSNVKNYLLSVQGTEGINWDKNNFPMYTV